MQRKFPILEYPEETQNRFIFQWISNKDDLIKSISRIDSFKDSVVSCIVVDDLHNFVPQSSMTVVLSMLFHASTLFPRSYCFVSTIPRVNELLRNYRLWFTHFEIVDGKEAKEYDFHMSIQKTNAEIEKSLM